jgi:predicted N-acetyltransferase YhbS
MVGPPMSDLLIERATHDDYWLIQQIVESANLPSDNVHSTPFLIARKDQIPVGVIGYSIEREGWVHVRSLSVRKSFRRQGIGEALIQALVDYLKTRDDATVLIVMCMYWNIRFYKNRGFQRISSQAKQHDPVAALEEHSHCTCFALRLQQPIEDVLAPQMLNAK